MTHLNFFRRVSLHVYVQDNNLKRAGNRLHILKKARRQAQKGRQTVLDTLRILKKVRRQTQKERQAVLDGG